MGGVGFTGMGLGLGNSVREGVERVRLIGR